MLQDLSNFIFTSKYAKYNESAHRRETWEEDVDRVESMYLKKFKHLPKEDKQEIKWAFDKVRVKLSVPSMRSMQFAGKAVDAHNARIYNCSVRHIDSIRSFSEVFYLLLCGCGVGIGLSKFFLGRLPDLVGKDDKTGSVITYTVQDTIEGWADSLEALLNCYFRNTAYTGRKIVFDYSKIRKKGEQLKTSGGKAPGYKGLKNAHRKIKELLDYAIEELGSQRLRTIDAYDILMHSADAVLSGGVRRSATCVVFDKDDTDMMNAKIAMKVKKNGAFEKNEKWEGYVYHKGKKVDVSLDDDEYDLLKKEQKVFWTHLEPQRGRSNNSVLLLRGQFTLDDISEVIKRTREGGDPGFVFADHPWTLFNPCQPEFATLLTESGIKTMGEISEGDKIWSQEGWTTVMKKWSTGVKPVFSYQTTAGMFIGTENHKVLCRGQKVEVMEADGLDTLAGETLDEIMLSQQSVLDGLMLGDGSVHPTSEDKVFLLIGAKDTDYFNDPVSEFIGEGHAARYGLAWKVKTTLSEYDLPKTHQRIIPDRFIFGDVTTKISFLRGLFSANGSVVRNRITLKATSLDVIRGAQLMLNSVGIMSYYTTNKPSTVHWKNGEYQSKQSYDLNISVDRKRFYNLIGFIQNYKMEALKKSIHVLGKRKKTFDIVGVDSLGDHEVFDITVDNSSHTYWTGGVNVSNCFEISFIPVTIDGVCGVVFCNLTSQNGSEIETFEDFLTATKAATIIGTLQATYTHFPYLGNVSQSLTEEEALLGVSITGLLDNPKILLSAKHQKEAAELAIQVNKEWAEKLGINPAARVTCVKPEGTSSLVLMSGSGIHPWHGKRFFRRVQMNKTDPVFKFFKKHNPHMCELSIQSENKTDEVVTFAITAPEGAIIKDDLTAIEHLDIIKSTQKNWVLPGSKNSKKPITNNVSCTVIVKEDEWDQVTEYLFENQKYFSAVALLGYFGDKEYKQAPLEKITEADEEKWNEIVSNFTPVDYTKLQEDEDMTEAAQTLSCAGGNCEIF
jgi:hypothetical protein